ncbi:hypothetical protein PG988_007547 [Apiospora saccharicola]
MNSARISPDGQPLSNAGDEPMMPRSTTTVSAVSHTGSDPLQRQSTESNNQGQANKHKPSAKWNPFFLSRLFLIPFTLVLATLATTLIVLRFASEKSQGFPLATHNRYLWTYAPTAVLVYVVSGWQQIEYRCKLLQPWRELRNGPTTASNSVLLDYISPIVFSSLWRAGKLRHISVLVALLGGPLLRLVIVASTGLLYPIPAFTPMQNITLEALTSFNRTDHVNAWSSRRESAFDYGAYALIAQNLALPDVSPFNLTWKPEPSGAPGVRLYLDSTVSWPSCLPSTNNEVHYNFFFEHPAWDGSGTFSPRQLYGQTSRIGCGDAADASTGLGGGRSDVVTDLGLLSILDVRYNQTSVAGATFQSEKNNVTGLWGIQIIGVTAAVCNATYTMGRTQVSYNFTRGFPKFHVDTSNITTTNQSIDGFSTTDFSERIFADLSEARHMAGNYLSNSMDESAPDPFWTMMTIIDGNSSSYETFVGNPLKIVRAAPVVLGYLAGQIVNYFATVDTSLPLEGGISFPVTRLTIDGLSVYMMLCGLVLAVAGSIVILINHPHDVVPCHVGALGGSGVVLSQSTEFQRVLRGCMGAKFKSALQNYMFISGPLNADDGSLVIRTENRFPSEPINVDDEPGPRNLSRRWWRPFILKPTAFAAITLVPVSLIVTLEVLQHLSVRSDGIATSISLEGYLVTFGTRILPSLVFTIVSLLYDSISFNILLFAPFSRLRKRATEASTTLHECLLDKIAPHAFYVALRHRHWAAALSVLASFVGALFPIFISGLYTFEVVPGPLPMTIERADTFSPAWPDSLSHDGGAAVLLTSFEMLNLSFPSLTNEEFALPRLHLSGSDVGRIHDSSDPVISLQLPALRGDLSCTAAEVKLDARKDYLTINGSSRPPLGCDGAAPLIEWSLKLQNDNPLKATEKWVGQIQDLHVQFPPGDIRGSGERNMLTTQDSQPGCPTLAFTFGKYSPASESDDQPTRANRSDGMHAADDRTVPDESSVRYLPSGPNGQTAFPYRPQVHFDLEVAIWDGDFQFGGYGSANVVTFYEDPNIVLDGFFALMLHPNNSVLPEELLGSQNQDRLQKEILSVYRRYMAQVASAKMRVPTDASSKPETFTATWVNPNRGVLRQNMVSRIVLQALLAVMVASGIAAYLLIDTKTVLQRNPCTIAGMATLLVDSAICNGQPTEGISQDADSVHSPIWGSLAFSLGWWEDEHDQERRPNHAPMGRDIVERMLHANWDDNAKYGKDVASKTAALPLVNGRVYKHSKLVMERIPTEIKLEVVRLLTQESPELACAYATVSREWQAFIEPTTFSLLKLNQERLHQARDLLTPVRQAYIRQIRFTALLPGYNHHGEPETEAEKKQNNEVFSDAVASLMELLGAWSSTHSEIELELSAACTIDLHDMKDMKDGRKLLQFHFRERWRRCIASYFKLNEGLYRQLPEIPWIGKFTYAPTLLYKRRLAPKTCCEIASRFPHLRTIDWHLADGSHDPAFRLQLRNEFATGLSTLRPRSVRDFKLNYQRGIGVERFFGEQDPRICPGASRDPLSVALGKLSMQLETITLYMTAIGSELLWDPDLHQEDQQGRWPLLRDFTLSFGGQTPQGEYLFDWNPEDADGQDSSRVIPIAAPLRPYQLAFARAARQMPNLRCFSASCGYLVSAEVDYTVQTRGASSYGSRAAELYCGSPVVGDVMADEVQEEWWHTAQVHIGKGDEFHFQVEDYGPKQRITGGTMPLVSSLNIKVEGDEVVGILDWETAGWFPLY